jgi:formylglycine-generating enzyme required for sulfatase activity
MDMPMNKDQVINEARSVLALQRDGFPVCADSLRIFTALRTVERLADETVIDELITNGFLVHAAERYHMAIESHMRSVGDCDFDMGTETSRARHFCGETPRHRVTLSEFMLSEFAVTNDVFALLDPARREAPEVTRVTPVVDVTWFDAALFAKWVGCRLPTEAEWEFACGVGTAGEWCCPEADLPRYAWYSENAEKNIHPVGTREPNSLSLFDMHGNVWEWCHDAYSADYYAHSPLKNPVNDDERVDRTAGDTHKVSRGGGYLALTEMCRIRYRLHDPASYSAADLGFRLATFTSK